LIERTAQCKLTRTAHEVGDGRARAGDATGRAGHARLFWAGVLILAPIVVAGSLSVGRYGIPLQHVAAILRSHLVVVEATWSLPEQRVVELVRLPRILAVCLAGAGLAVAGAALQGVFRNPLVDSQIIGVSSGAAFGGAWAILLFDNATVTVASAFAAGLAAIVIVYLISRITRQTQILLLVLAGVVTSAFFSALVSLIKFVADPDNKLPAIVYWLMGSFAGASWRTVAILGGPTVLGVALIHGLRFRINVLSLGDEDAQALGVSVERTRWLILGAVALISAAVVAVAGIIGWVGLVIPHAARGVVGPDHKLLLPASAALGALYLLLIDDVARAATAAEIPLGIITAIIGAPVFAVLLRRSHAGGWRRD
jgi:iron complex transport system permease protein